MIDRRTKNAEIFRDTEQRYTTDQALVQAVRQATEAQVFFAEKSAVDVPAPSKTEKAKVIVLQSASHSSESPVQQRLHLHAQCVRVQVLSHVCCLPFIIAV